MLSPPNVTTLSVESRRLRVASAIVSSLGEGQLLRHNVVLSAGTVSAGLLGVLLQSMISHQLAPGDYGAAFTVITLLGVLGPAVSWVSLVMARTMSQALAEQKAGAGAAMLRTGNRRLLIAGGLLALLVVVTSPVIAVGLRVPVQLLVLAAPGIPFIAALPLLAGALSGEQRFAQLALVFVANALFRLVASVSLAAVWGPAGVIAGMSLAGLLAYLLGLVFLRGLLKLPPASRTSERTTQYVLVVAVSSFAQAILLTSDVVLAKHFFSGQVAGEYAVVAVLGRAVYWGATGVAAVLFPKVVFHEAQGKSARQIIVASLALAAVGGLSVVLAFSFSATLIIRDFAGSAYLGGASYLGWYALGMTALGGATVLVATHQSGGRPAFLWVLLGVTFLEPLAILFLHDSPRQLVAVVVTAMTLLLLGLAAIRLDQWRSARTSALA